jgi:hypothetical protein
MLATAAWRTFQILFFQAGPQDFPYSPQLSRGSAAICALATAFLLQILVPFPVAIAVGIVSVAVIASLTQTLLNLRKLPNRFEQTLGALMAAGIAFCVLALPIAFATAPEFLKVMNDPAMLERARTGTTPQLDLPVGAALGWDLVFFWSIAVFANIFRQAADFSAAAGVLMVIVLVFVQMIVSSFAAAVVRSAIG